MHKRDCVPAKTRRRRRHRRRTSDERLPQAGTTAVVGTTNCLFAHRRLRAIYYVRHRIGGSTTKDYSVLTSHDRDPPKTCPIQTLSKEERSTADPRIRSGIDLGPAFFSLVTVLQGRGAVVSTCHFITSPINGFNGSYCCETCGAMRASPQPASSVPCKSAGDAPLYFASSAWTQRFQTQPASSATSHSANHAHAHSSRSQMQSIGHLCAAHALL